MELINTLKELCTYTAVSGHEGEMAVFLKGLFEKYCDSVEIDRFYNVIAIKKGIKSNAKKVMVTAHYDEIGFLVKSIDEKGFIKLTNIGGIDSKFLLAQEVIIHGKKSIPGVIGAKPPHLLKPEEARKAVKQDDLAVDTGMSFDKVKELISIGDIVTFKSEPLVLQGNKVSSKSMDNRCGVAALLKLLEELSVMKHEAEVCCIATTQEEVGLRGVITAAYNAEPDMAIVIDACHGDMPDAPKDEVYNLGKGPAIAVGPNLHRLLTNKLIDTAKAENFSYQIDTEPEDTGTEAWATQVSRSGIPTVLISIPVRYMHTTIETVHVKDIENTAKLAVKFIMASKGEVPPLD